MVLKIKDWRVEHLMRYKFDHTPILLTISNEAVSKKKKKSKGFKFETCWLLDKGMREWLETHGSLRMATRKPILEDCYNECVHFEQLLDDLNDKHEAYWYLRSQVAEVKDDDRNTKYFHHKVSQ
ncbi:putative kinetochore protein NUF2 [Bienertia sinuspersici]